MTDASKLREAVDRLENELRDVDSLDGESRVALQEALAEIQHALQHGQPDQLEHESLIDRLNDATHEFEGKHPSLTQALARLIDGLGQMGI